MAYSSILASEIQVGDPITAALMTKIKDNDDHLNGLIGGLDFYDVYNGSFDIDADSDDVPDGWTVNLLTGGSGSLVSADTEGHGKNTYQAVDPGGASNGGAELISPYIAVTGLRQLFFGWVMDTNAAGMHIKLDIERYKHDKTTAGADENLYDEQTANPTLPKQMWAGYAPGSGNIRFIRLKFTLGDTDKNQAGTAEVSGVSMATSLPQLFSATTFTFTSRTTSAGTWTSLGSVLTVNLPHDWYIVGNVPLFITFPFEFEWNGTPSSNDEAQIRFLVDGTATNVTTFHESAVGGTTGQCQGTAFAKVSPTGESFDIQPQAQITVGSSTISVHKDHIATSISFMTPGS